MMPKMQGLITTAKALMANSRDPIHDLSHVTRVVQYTEQFCKRMGLNPEQTQSLILAAWWHDAARTLTRKPSIVWMVFVDDILSAAMLWFQTVRHGLFGSVAGMAGRIILCKSLGTGAIFTRLLMRKKNRILVDILKDADLLDILDQERLTKLMAMAETSRVYHLGYRTTVRWFLTGSRLEMKTAAAREYLEQILRTFIDWVKRGIAWEWHIREFGKEWVEVMLERAEILLKHIRDLNSHSTLATAE